MAAKKKGNTVEQVRALAEPIAKELGLSIWDVRFLKEGGLWYLRMFIDKPEGVGIDDCEAMSRAINTPLDELDPIEESYCLEISSPGLNRALTRPEHFMAYLGSLVGVKRIRPDENGNRELRGVLLEYADGVLKLGLEDGSEVAVDKKDTASVCLLDDDSMEVEEI